MSSFVDFASLDFSSVFSEPKEALALREYLASQLVSAGYPPSLLDSTTHDDQARPALVVQQAYVRAQRTNDALPLVLCRSDLATLLADGDYTNDDLLLVSHSPAAADGSASSALPTPHTTPKNHKNKQKNAQQSKTKKKNRKKKSAKNDVSADDSGAASSQSASTDDTSSNQWSAPPLLAADPLSAARREAAYAAVARERQLRDPRRAAALRRTSTLASADTHAWLVTRDLFPVDVQHTLAHQSAQTYLDELARRQQSTLPQSLLSLTREAWRQDGCAAIDGDFAVPDVLPEHKLLLEPLKSCGILPLSLKDLQLRLSAAAMPLSAAATKRERELYDEEAALHADYALLRLITLLTRSALGLSDPSVYEIYSYLLPDLLDALLAQRQRAIKQVQLDRLFSVLPAGVAAGLSEAAAHRVAPQLTKDARTMEALTAHAAETRALTALFGGASPSAPTSASAPASGGTASTARLNNAREPLLPTPPSAAPSTNHRDTSGATPTNASGSAPRAATPANKAAAHNNNTNNKNKNNKNNANKANTDTKKNPNNKQQQQQQQPPKPHSDAAQDGQSKA